MSTQEIDREAASSPGPSDPLPDRSIVLCAVPGAGEHLVASALADAGAGAGRAWFDVDAVAGELLARWGIANVDDYIAALHEHETSPDGVFAMTLHWHQLRRLHRQVAGLRQPTPDRLREVVEWIAPQPTFVWVRRHDRAAHTDALAATPYAARAGAATVGALLDATDAIWAQWFAELDVTPIQVSSDDPATVRELIAELDLAAR